MLFLNKTGIVLALMLMTCTAHAQHIFTGLIRERELQTPIHSTIITWSEKENTIVVNEDGRFSISAADSLLSIKITSLGYKPATNVLQAGKENLIDLETDHVKLQDIQLYAAGQAPKAIMQWDLGARPVRSSQELLKVVPGLFIAQHQGGGKAEQIFIRGFDIDHGTDINISVDGVPANMVSHAHGQGYADVHYLIPELVREIDYGMGPYNTSYGNQATAGYVSFTTLNALKNNSVQVEAGQFNSFRALAMLNLLKKNNARDNKNWYIAGEYMISDGPFISPQNFSRANVFSKFTGSLSRNSELSLQASAFYSKWDASGQVPDRLVKQGMISRFGSVDDTEGGETSRANLNALITTKLSNNLKLVNQFYATRYNFNLFSNFTFFLDDPVNGDQIQQKEMRNIYGYSTRLEKNKNGLNSSSKTVVSAGFRADRINDSRLTHTLNRKEILDEIKRGDIRETNGFLYASYDLRFKKWFIQAGNRFDVFYFRYADKLNNITGRTVKSINSPKLSVQHTVSSKLQLYVKTGKGFHSNDTRVITEQQQDILPAVFASDLGFILKPSPDLYINIAAWQMNSKQEFVYVGDEGIVESSGSSRRTGIDAAIRYQLKTWLSADLNLNLSKPLFTDVAKEEAFIPLAPRFCSSGGIHFTPAIPFSGSIRYRHLGNRPANETNTIIASGYTVFDVNLLYHYQKFTWGVAIENVLNSSWNEAQFNTVSRLQNEVNPVEEIHYTPGNPVNARIKMTYTF